MKHLLITAADAARIASALQHATDTELRRIGDRLATDTGGDLEDIADNLKRLTLCAACVLEGQQAHCSALNAQKIGRRLTRLIGRAEGTWPPRTEDE